MSKTKQLETITGTVTKIIFQSVDGGFTIGKLDGNTFKIKCGVAEGDTISLQGKWVNDPKFGRQFDASSFCYDMPCDTAGLAAWMAKNQELKGIGPVTAAEICKRYGNDFDKNINNESVITEMVTRITRLTYDMVVTLRVTWNRSKHMNQAMTALYAFDLTANQVNRLIEKYGSDAPRIVRENPYRMIEDLTGFGFKRADEIARKAGIAKDDENRIKACIKYVLQEALQNGNTCMLTAVLICEAERLLIFDKLETMGLVGTHVFYLCQINDLIMFGDDKFVALSYMYNMEMDVFNALKKKAESMTAKYELTSDNADLIEKQYAALEMALCNKLCLITGGAGTGKTYTITSIIEVLENNDKSINLCAPTGKAAKRMSESTGRPASTIHRLLEHNGRCFQRDAENKLDCEVLIIDEVSMLDVVLCWHLFNAVDFDRTSIIMVGDHNQLPPVGAGNVLRDIIQKQLIPTVKLTEVIRQAGVLKQNSIAILRGVVAPNSPGSGVWYVSDGHKEPEDVLKMIKHLYKYILPNNFTLNHVNDVQLLTPQHKGLIGTDNLNKVLQRIIQQQIYGVNVIQEPEKKMPVLYHGDRVMQIVNDYELDVMNGAVGYISSISNDGYVIDFY
ncbi:AAA family ATPase, partial [Patescibacteria group bacterium]|nr:AAA family ATPase [Patescibacteria group bacterium]